MDQAVRVRGVWHRFGEADLAKPVLQGEGVDAAEKAETQATVAYVIDLICQLLHPFMPFLTEELWAQKAEAGAPRKLAAGDASLVCLTRWPDLSALKDAAAEAEIGFVVDLISDIRSVRSEVNVPAGTQAPLVLVNASAATRATIESWRPMIERLARVSDIAFEAAAPAQSAQIIVRGEVAALPLAGLILAFFRSTAELLAELDDLGERIRPDGMIWSAWPRKAATRGTCIEVWST